ncbi:MAG: SDR family oxidoreductase [Ferruginibacter sp.]
MSKIPSILITGATGNTGTELAKQLSLRGVPFRAMVRSLEKATALASLEGAEIVTGDFSDPASITNALIGIEHTFLLTNSSEQAEKLQGDFIDIARGAGLRHIVKLSQLAADIHSPVRFLRYHAAVEQKIKESGIAYTFLRPNLFMQGLLGFRDPIVQQGKFFASIGDAKISLVDIRDIAAVAVEALIDKKHEGKIYDLTGPEALTHEEIAAHLSRMLGREIKFINVSPADMRQAVIAAGFPEWQADGLIEDYAHYSRGEAAAISRAVKHVTGRAPRNFETFARDYVAAFS